MRDEYDMCSQFDKLLNFLKSTVQEEIIYVLDGSAMYEFLETYKEFYKISGLLKQTIQF